MKKVTQGKKQTVEEYWMTKNMPIDEKNKKIAIKALSRLIKPLKMNSKVKAQLNNEMAINHQNKKGQIMDKIAVENKDLIEILRSYRDERQAQNREDYFKNINHAEQILMDMDRKIGERESDAHPLHTTQSDAHRFDDGTVLNRSQIDEEFRLNNRVSQFVYEYKTIEENYSNPSYKKEKLEKLKEKFHGMIDKKILFSRSRSEDGYSSNNPVSSPGHSPFKKYRLLKNHFASKSKERPKILERLTQSQRPEILEVRLESFNKKKELQKGFSRKVIDVLPTVTKMTSESATRRDASNRSLALVDFGSSDLSKSNDKILITQQLPSLILDSPQTKRSNLDKSPPSSKRRAGILINNSKKLSPHIESMFQELKEVINKFNPVKRLQAGGDSKFNKENQERRPTLEDLEMIDNKVKPNRNDSENQQTVQINDSPKYQNGEMAEIPNLKNLTKRKDKERKYFKEKLHESQADRLTFAYERSILKAKGNKKLFLELFNEMKQKNSRGIFRHGINDVEDEKATFRMTRKIFIKPRIKRDLTGNV